MKGTVTLTARDQIRVMTLNRVLEGALTAVQAADQLGLSERQVRRLLAAYRQEGAAAIPHRNRGRPPAHALPAAVQARVLALSRTTYAGTNDSHFRDLLEEREGIALSLSTVRRIRRAAGEPSPRQRRPPAHRQRRERRPQEGMLLQLDGSPHDWLQGRGPRLTLLAAIDDATGQVAGAVWREQEDSLGYLALLEQIGTTVGRPEAVYHDRSGIFVHHDHERETIEEQLVGAREPRQVGRALAELGIASIAAQSPQAKGRVERLFGTLQDRLVAELALAGAATLAEATVVLAEFLPRFNRRFGVPAARAGTAYRPLPPELAIRQVCCLKQRRVVANDDTIAFEGHRLQLLPGHERLTYVRATVEVRQHLDGTLSVLVWRARARLAACAGRRASAARANAVGAPGGCGRGGRRAPRGGPGRRGPGNQAAPETGARPSLAQAAQATGGDIFTDQFGVTDSQIDNSGVRRLCRVLVARAAKLRAVDHPTPSRWSSNRPTKTRRPRRVIDAAALSAARSWS
jgi:transposase